MHCIALLLAILAPAVGLVERGAALAQGGAAIRYDVVPEGTEVRYRVREQLVGLSFPNDAVGATNAVDGSIVFDAQGRLVSGQSRVTVDLRTLRSDEPRRDNYLRRNTLETERYPTVTFLPAEARGLPVPSPNPFSVTRTRSFFFAFAESLAQSTHFFPSAQYMLSNDQASVSRLR